MTNQETIKSISNEWTTFAKANFYHEAYPEFQDYAAITDAQWNNFGKVMAYIREDGPQGSNCRAYYRAYAQMLTVGKEGTKALMNEIIDGTAHPFSIAYYIIDFIGYSELIFDNNKKTLEQK